MKKQHYLLLAIGFVIMLSACQNKCETASENRAFNGSYGGKFIDRIVFPIGGMGAGMFCIEGTGYFSHMSILHKPDIYNEPGMFAALHVKGYENGTKILEGPVSEWRKFGPPNSGLGSGGVNYGLPRFHASTFEARFPFGKVSLKDGDIPVDVTITAWNPFIPGDADNSGLPVGIIEYTFENKSGKALETVFSFNTPNFSLSTTAYEGNANRRVRNQIKSFPNGFVLSRDGTPEAPHNQAAFAIFTDQPNTAVNHSWFRGGWFDGVTMAWNEIKSGEIIKNDPIRTGAPGASLYVPVSLKAGEKKTVKVFTSWYVPFSNLREGDDLKDITDNNVPEERLTTEIEERYYRPWYSTKFKNVNEVADYIKANYDQLRTKTELFTNAFYNTTLPAEVIEAIAANLTILKSPTIMRQYDGRMWNWEGCGDSWGSCHGTCTHVWNYTQAIPHLFPDMERTLRHTEFEESQSKITGHQTFRSSLPIRPLDHDFHSAADGQLGGIMKVYREWRISGDEAFVKDMFPKVKASLEYCINTWDPRRVGIIEEPHHNTYDIEFWGPDGMHNSFYIGALNAFIAMSEYLGEDASQYKDLAAKCKAFTEAELFNGEYFIQKIQWTGLQAPDPTQVVSWTVNYSDEAKALLEKEGPKYQYGNGCLSDGVWGAMLARACGLDEPLDPAKIKSHLVSVHKYNLKQNLINHENPQRPTYAFGTDGGLLLCSWPHGGKLSLPFVYSDEVWTGIEYQVASHLMLNGEVEKGLDIVRACRKRYDGRTRNPFNEYEYGSWYARALSSYAMFQALTGVRYDAVDGTLYIDSKIGNDFTSFISTNTGFGNVGLKNGKPFVDVKNGSINVKKCLVSGVEVTI